MKKLFLFILLISYSLSGFSQSKIDSLEKVLKVSEEKDKAYIYFLLAKEVYYKDILKVAAYSQKADSLAKMHNIDSIRVNALNILSYASIHSGKLEQAIIYNKKAFQIADSSKLTKESISSQYFKGYYYYATGQSDSSLFFLKQAYQRSIDSKEARLQLQCINTIAANYLNQAKYNDALENFTRAYQLADSLNIDKVLINISLNIGTTLLYNEEFDNAMKYFEKVIAKSDSLDATIAYAAALTNMGACYTRKGEDEKALGFFNRALLAFKQLNNLIQVGLLYTNLGQTNYRLNNMELASSYLQKAIDLNRANKIYTQLIISLIIDAEVQVTNQNFSKAKLHLDEANELIDQYNINTNKKDLYSNYSYYYTKTKQFEKALEYKQKELNEKDRTFTETRQQQISELETKFETKLKENENESLRKDLALHKLNTEKQTQIRNFLIIVFLLVIVLVLILLNRARLKKLSHQIIENQKSELEIANSTKDKFFAIIAHDLRSPFSALVGLCELLSQSYEEIGEKERKMYINDLHNASMNTFNLLENLLTWSRIQQGSIKIHKEEQDISSLIANIIQLTQAAAKLKNISIINSIPQNSIATFDKNSTETVLMNLVNNAIKFTHEKGSISISSEEKNGNFIVAINDSGVGMTEKQITHLFKIDENISTPGTNKETGTGLGLILCEEFMELNNGKIWVESKQGEGSTFYLSFEK
ncbi:hypothetical protein BZG02_08020 [Labilibaculum filiforme]|uniref:histidine kinase n=1 Tax=Labilibaculum filiforme TaxID=1940526 RepID=A0A2N3I0U8_9BACT|nr:tetratricopeptide repeat protein [Labilibaculum filiforme]PKQ63949.1 hypothetical protein BZG02_08020 [Labilibaculum filiforme]